MGLKSKEKQQHHVSQYKWEGKCRTHLPVFWSSDFGKSVRETPDWYFLCCDRTATES